MVQRGRKKGANGEQSRALLLAIAAEEFAKNGYHETKISTIVKRAAVSQPTFYLYFQNKESIFQELVDLFRDRLVEYTNNSRLEPGIDLDSVSDRISVGLTNMLTFFAENPHLTQIGFFISSKASEMKSQLVAQIQDNLTFEVEQGYFCKDIDMNIVAESLVGIIERLTFTKLLQENADPVKLANEVVHLFLYGMTISKDK